MAIVPGSTLANTIHTEINQTRDYIAQRTSAVQPIAKGGTGATTAGAASPRSEAFRALKSSTAPGACSTRCRGTTARVDSSAPLPPRATTPSLTAPSRRLSPTICLSGGAGP